MHPSHALRRYCTAAAVRGTVVSFVGRYPLIRLDNGETVTVRDNKAPFMMAQQTVLLAQRGEEWAVQEVVPQSASGRVLGDSNALWNNKFAKQARRK